MQGLSFKKLTSMAYLQKYYFRKKTNNVLYSTEKNQLKNSFFFYIAIIKFESRRQKLSTLKKSPI